jgi:hypothetical protein
VVFDYTPDGGALGRRRVRFLVGSPSNMLTGIDIDKRRIRTYRLDRISAAFDASGNRAADVLSHIVAESSVDPLDLVEQDPDRDLALTMRKEMLAALSLLTLMATTDGRMSLQAHKSIMEYVVRDNRFAVREGWVAAGDKRRVWPILADFVRDLRPLRTDLSAYVLSLHEEWDNSRRFKVLNEALVTVGQIDGRPTAAKIELAEQINRLG